MFVTLFKCAGRLPLAWLQAVGAALGWLVWWASPTYRRRFRDHVAQAGVPWGPNGSSAGRIHSQGSSSAMRPADEPLGPRVRWDGAEHIEDALARGRGVVFLTPHLGCFEVTAQAYAERFGAAHGPITVLYRPPRKAALRPLAEEARRRPGLTTAPATLAGVRQMIRALRAGQAVGLLPDQVPPEGLGVWSPFFGRPAYTMTLAARLAQQTGAQVLLAWGERLPRGQGYVVHVSEFEDPLPADDQGESAAASINHAMERLIRQAPGQYLWGYHRYKAPRREAALLGKDA